MERCLRGYRFTAGTTDNESRGLYLSSEVGHESAPKSGQAWSAPVEDFGHESRGLYLSSEVGRESLATQDKPLNAQPRGLYLSSEVGRESAGCQEKTLASNQEDYTYPAKSDANL